MSGRKSFSNRFVWKENGIIGPTPPRPKTIVRKTVGDYPGLSQAYLDVAENYASRKLRGPGICDELMELIQHMFTEEEASICRHVKPGAMDCTAAAAAEAEHRPVEEVREVLNHLTHEKRILMSFGKGDQKVYFAVPIVPGMFELVLVNTSMDLLTDWHRRFAELFERMYETGFTASSKRPKGDPAIRYLPMGVTIESNQMALPSDKLEEVYAPYKTFAVGLCQCRIVEDVVGRNCGRPMEVCVGIGRIAEAEIKTGRMRPVELKEVLEIKAEAEASGLVSWMMNLDPKTGSNTSCSCCGCCCHYMRSVSEFSMPAAISPPHFLPVRYTNKCATCGKCAL
ncbi:MAG: hypothetical protein GY866_29720, partial [Proteobacteria bacterium]|nr:hypothetical protein [Pseudomonadota bacterium]